MDPRAQKQFVDTKLTITLSYDATKYKQFAYKCRSLAELLLQFAENIGLAIVLTYGLAAITGRVAPRYPRMVQPASGILFGLLAVLFMSLPFELRPGVIFDLRNLVVFLAGPFGGPVAAIVAGTLAGAYRLYLGGAGVIAGIGGILTAMALGCLVSWRYRQLASWKQAAFWGAVLFAVCIPWVFAVDDIAFGWHLLELLALPSAIFYIGGSVLLSALFMADLRRRAAEKLIAFNEKRFRDIAEMASDWFWEMDENLKVTYVSHRLREITGFTAEEFHGKKRQDLIAKISEADLEEHEKTLRDRKPFRDLCYFIRTADGGSREVVTSGKPIFGDDGRFLGYRGNGRDFSAEGRYRREMEAARLNAELANQAKSSFLAAMSHELRTPLNAIIGFSEIMKQELFGKLNVPAYKGYVADINSSAEYLLSLVNDVLDVARVESGRIELERSTCDLEQIVQSAVRLLKERADNRDIHLTTEIQPQMPIACLDERAIKQVIVNVVTNAVKFTEPGGSVTVTAEVEADGDFQITVADTGIGIDSNELAAVLEPFHQLASGKRVDKEGTGLGLTLSKALVEEHGGRFAIESEPGSGTIVRISLPKEASDRSSEEVQPQADTSLAS